MVDSAVKTILVVDDEPSIITYFTILLEENGYKVRSASSAEEALKIARLDPPDLVTLDIVMPKRSGLSCYQRIREDSILKDVPVIIVSAFGLEKDFKGERFNKFFKSSDVPEPDCFMEKPIVADVFIETIEALIGSGAGA